MNVRLAARHLRRLIQPADFASMPFFTPWLKTAAFGSNLPMNEVTLSTQTNAPAAALLRSAFAPHEKELVTDNYSEGHFAVT